MGYDMRTRTTPAEEKEAVAAARKALQAAADKFRRCTPDSPERQALRLEWEDAANLLEEADVSYFRLNNSGMWQYLEAMLDTGMAHDSGTPVQPSEWPKYPDNDDEDGADYKAYRAAVDPLLARHVTEEATIPSHKFGSNDGWWVTPAEISAALAAWDQLDTSAVKNELSTQAAGVLKSDYWAAWVKFLRLAADRDGFTVH